MDSLGRYIATACISGTVALLSRYLEPRTRIVFWQSHDFLYKIPTNQLPPQPVASAPRPSVAQPALPAPGAAAAAAPAPVPFFIRTQSVSIKNLGRKPAEWVEIVHAQRPDFFQLNPSLNYTEDVTPTGEHVIRVNSLAPKEFFTIQFLSYLNAPQPLYIRSAAGHASSIPVMAVRQYPRWVYYGVRGLLVIGGGFTVYSVIRTVEFLLRAMGVL
jgi:hypothetical protein